MATNRGGAVSVGTEMMEWGAQQMEEGWAMSAGAGQPANVQTSLMQAAQQRGAAAANAIRQRYFKKEFDLVQSVHAAKIYAEMEAAQAQHEFDTKVEMGAVQTIQSSAEAMQEDIDLTNMGSANVSQPNLGVNSNPPGVADTPVAHSEVAPPAPTSDGGVHTEQAYSYLLPDGRRIGIATQEGFMHQQQSTMRVGEAIKNGTIALKDLAAKYTGNPFFDKWMESIDDSVVQHSNMATTGSGDPAEAMKKYQQFQQRDADITASEDVHESRVFDQDTRQAIRDQGADEFIMRAQSDENFTGNVKSDLLERARNNPESLTPTMRAKLGVGLQSWKADAEKSIAAAKQSGMFKFTPQQLAVPENVPAFMANDRRRGQLYTQHRAEAAGAAGEIARGLVQDGDPNIHKKLRDLGATEADIIEFREGVTSANMQEVVLPNYVESDPDLYRRANGRADVERLIEIMRNDPQGAGGMVSAEVEGFIARHPEFTDKQVDKIRANDANYFIQITQGYDPGYTSAASRQADRQINERYSQRPTVESVDGPLAPPVLGPSPSEQDVRAYNLGLPSAPTRPSFPRVTHATGSASLVERAMGGSGFTGPASVSDLDMIAREVATRKIAARISRAKSQGGQTLDSMRPNAERRRTARIANR